jgi:hypothetical protein
MIRLQFSTQASLVSRAIAFETHGWCSHVDTVMPDGRLLGAHMSGGVQDTTGYAGIWVECPIDGFSGTATVTGGGTETRPRNVNILACIAY